MAELAKIDDGEITLTDALEAAREMRSLLVQLEEWDIEGSTWCGFCDTSPPNQDWTYKPPHSADCPRRRLLSDPRWMEPGHENDPLPESFR